MSNVVYLISSLPSLTFGQKPPISLDLFHTEAQEQLPLNKFKKLQNLDIKNIPEFKPTILKKFIEAMHQLQNDITEVRNAKANERSPAINILPKAVVEQNPLEREKSIMKWQWEQLTNIDSGETFTFTEVLAYKLKLQILHRLDSFNAEKGFKILETIIKPSKNKEEK